MDYFLDNQDVLSSDPLLMLTILLFLSYLSKILTARYLVMN